MHAAAVAWRCVAVVVELADSRDTSRVPVLGRLSDETVVIPTASLIRASYVGCDIADMRSRIAIVEKG
jgi:hypothetical protein